MNEIYLMNDQQVESVIDGLPDTSGHHLSISTLKNVIEKCVNEDRAAQQKIESPENSPSSTEQQTQSKINLLREAYDKLDNPRDLRNISFARGVLGKFADELQTSA